MLSSHGKSLNVTSKSHGYTHSWWRIVLLSHKGVVISQCLIEMYYWVIPRRGSAHSNGFVSLPFLLLWRLPLKEATLLRGQEPPAAPQKRGRQCYYYSCPESIPPPPQLCPRHLPSFTRPTWPPYWAEKSVVPAQEEVRIVLYNS